MYSAPTAIPVSADVGVGRLQVPSQLLRGLSYGPHGRASCRARTLQTPRSASLVILRLAVGGVSIGKGRGYKVR
jgi:hypothetical protein